jgi:hypothetical protein
MIKMCPFGGFRDFDFCVSEQMRKHKGEKGFTIENARKICGFIKAKTEHK